MDAAPWRWAGIAPGGRSHGNDDGKPRKLREAVDAVLARGVESAAEAGFRSRCPTRLQRVGRDRGEVEKSHAESAESSEKPEQFLLTPMTLREISNSVHPPNEALKGGIRSLGRSCAKYSLTDRSRQAPYAP